jgi:hypothetical protein
VGRVGRKEDLLFLKKKKQKDFYPFSAVRAATSSERRRTTGFGSS